MKIFLASVALHSVWAGGTRKQLAIKLKFERLFHEYSRRTPLATSVT